MSCINILCIPRINSNICETTIYKVFERLNIGIIERIDIVKKKNKKGELFNCAFIHLNKWNNTENSKIACERLSKGKEIKIIYDNYLFWKVSAYKKHEYF